MAPFISTTPSTATTKRCITCVGPAIYSCGRCHSVTYCNRKCQQYDWLAHKHFCALTDSEETLYPPKSSKSRMIRGILFSSDSNLAQFVNIPYESRKDGDMSIDTEEFLKANHPGAQEMETMDFERNIFDDRPFYREGIKLVFWHNAFENPNQCIETITGGKGQIKWEGNLLVVGARRRQGDGGLMSIIRKGSHEYVDIGVSDVRDVIDCLIAYCKEGKEKKMMNKQNLRNEFEKAIRAHIRQNLERYLSSDNARIKPSIDPAHVQGVVSLCKGHSRSYNVTGFISTSFPPYLVNWIQTYGDILPVTKLIRFPLLYLEVPNKNRELIKAPEIASKSDFKQNDFATYMHLDPDTFYPPPKWEFMEGPGGGSIFVMRKDLKPLFAEHCDVLQAWGEWLLWDWQQWRRKSPEERSGVRKRWGDGIITHKSFESYWKEKASEKWQDGDKGRIPGPYE